MARNDSLATMTVKIAANTAQFNTAIKQTQGQLKAFGDSVTSAAKSFVAGFGAIQVANFTLEVSKLAGEAEGVRVAFEKLPNSVKVMQQLKEATGGTVSELELMKRAVTATNFGIDLAALPKLLEFAAVRAQQTGQSVDYLVDSIVTGIGRKSPLILDNLGISTTRLKEKFGGAALEAQSIGDVAKAVGAIAEEELGKMGKLSDNASTRMAKLSAEWENLKVVIGDSLNAVDDTKAFTLSKMTADLTAFFKVLQDNKIANQITEQKGGIFASLFPNIDQLFSIRELSKEIEKIKDGAREFAKINTEGFIKVPTLGLRIQESINKITEDNRKKEIERLDALKKINVERSKEFTKLKDFQEAFRRSQEDQDLLQRQNPTFSPMFQVPEVGSFNPGDLEFPDPEEVDSDVQRLVDGLITVREQAQQTREAFAVMALAIGDSIGAAIQNQESFANIMIRTTQVIIDQIQKQIINNILLGTSKAFAANPVLGIAVVGIAGGIIKGLLGKAKVGGGQVSSPQYSNSGYTPFGAATVRVYQRGTDMEGTLTETQRLGKRTKG